MMFPTIIYGITKYSLLNLIMCIGRGTYKCVMLVYVFFVFFFNKEGWEDMKMSMQSNAQCVTSVVKDRSPLYYYYYYHNDDTFQT